MNGNVFLLAMLLLFNLAKKLGSVRSLQNGILNISSRAIQFKTVTLIVFVSKFYVCHFRHYILHLRMLLCGSIAWTRWRALFLVLISRCNTSTTNKGSNGLWHSRKSLSFYRTYHDFHHCTGLTNRRLFGIMLHSLLSTANKKRTRSSTRTRSLHP